MPQKEKDTLTGTTPYDDIFRTILEKAPELMIPLVNEAFGTQYAFSSEIVQFRNEHMLPNGRIITDSHFYVGELTIDNHHYHVECESRKDGSIELRMVEYDFFIALEGTYQSEDGTYHLHLPASAVLYLRHRPDTPDETVIHVHNAEGASIPHRIRIIKAQSYTWEELLRKKLLALMPFYLFRYEKDFEALEKDEIRLNAFVREYQSSLDELAEDMAVSEDFAHPEAIYTLLIELAKKANINLLKKQDHAKRKVEKIMGGKVLKLKSVEILDNYRREREEGRQEGRKEGLQEGRQEGRNEGEIIGAIKLYRDELHLPPEEIVKKVVGRFDLSEEDAEKFVVEALGVKVV